MTKTGNSLMSLRQGAAMSFSRGQKLNVRSSTECKLVRIDDAIPQMMWGKHFIEAQGWTVEHNILYQDNKSIILLVTNGRSSSSKRTKDINHRYFFIKEKVVCGNLEIRHALIDLDSRFLNGTTGGTLQLMLGLVAV